MGQPRVLLLDNLDSFTFNVAQQMSVAGAEVVVRRAPEATVQQVKRFDVTHLVLSPGPLRPEAHPRNAELLAAFARQMPILGICLGMQAINGFYGGTLRCDDPPIHGKTSLVEHDATGLFHDVPNPLTVARYHSLIVDRVGEGLTITARTRDQRIMAIRHEHDAVYGIQFHPESFLTVGGELLMRNFLYGRA